MGSYGGEMRRGLGNTCMRCDKEGLGLISFDVKMRRAEESDRGCGI